MPSMSTLRLSSLVAALLVGSLSPLPAAAQEPVKIRLGTLAPKGSSYHRALQEMAEKWRAAAGGGSSFIIYTDGTQGGEADMVRRMRVGQLNGALLSGLGMAEIDNGIGAMQFIPMLFRDWAEVDFARERVRATLEKRMLERGFVVLFWGDAGWVRYFAEEPSVRPEDFKRAKMWVNASDTRQSDLMKSLGYQPVPLEIADILPGLQTGLITALPMGTFYALAGQFDTVAKHMLDLRWAPLLGGAVVTKKAWDAMTPAARDALRVAADQAGAKIRERGRQEDQEAIEAMKKRGLTVHPATPEIQAEWRKLAEGVYPRIRNEWVPPEIFDQVHAAVQDYRKQHGK
jgi:TRAP-type C4-dicarboxylate transport system substrate-binding protein